jgi:hypothetical protein
VTPTPLVSADTTLAGRLVREGAHPIIAGLKLRVNHPITALGVTEWIPASLTLYDNAAAGCETHVVVRVQAQTRSSRFAFQRGRRGCGAGPRLLHGV